MFFVGIVLCVFRVCSFSVRLFRCGSIIIMFSFWVIFVFMVWCLVGRLSICVCCMWIMGLLRFCMLGRMSVICFFLMCCLLFGRLCSMLCLGRVGFWWCLVWV